MQIDISSGLIREARQVSSPNADDRPAGVRPELVVIHSISLPPGEYGGPWIEQLFCNRLPADEHPYFAEIHALKVSAHVLIRRDGELVQFVPFQRRAWHAGESSYQGRERCNDFSIGIELEGSVWQGATQPLLAAAHLSRQPKVWQHIGDGSTGDREQKRVIQADATIASDQPTTSIGIATMPMSLKAKNNRKGAGRSVARVLQVFPRYVRASPRSSSRKTPPIRVRTCVLFRVPTGSAASALHGADPSPERIKNTRDDKRQGQREGESDRQRAERQTQYARCRDR